MGSPTQRTLALLRKQGWTAAVVEKWNPHAKVRIDMFGCIDIVAIRSQSPLVPYSLDLMLGESEGIIGIQACAGASHAARAKKAWDQPGLHKWLAAGGKFAVMSWAKRGARGKRKVWTPRVEWLATPPSRG